MIRRDHILCATLMMLWLSAPAAAGTLYKCVGGPDQATNYSGSPVPGMSCKAITYKGGSSRGHSPMAFGSGSAEVDSAPGTSGGGPAKPANSGTNFPTPEPAPATADAGSIAIPTPAGAPAIAMIGATPSRASIARARGTLSSDASESLPAPTIPPAGQPHVLHKILYRYTDSNGDDHFEDEIHKPRDVEAKVIDEHTETCKDGVHCQEVGWDPDDGNYSYVNPVGPCFACRVLPGVNFGTLALNTSAYALEISAAARMYGVDEALVRAIIHAESDYNPNAVSYKGAQGLMQLMPATASRFGVQNPFAAAENINGGVQYLSFLSKRFNGDVRLIAAAYNAGEANVDRYGGVPPFAETQRYVERVGTLAERYRSAK